jgi:hypothetical protein
MTATHVNGREVVAEEPAASPLSTPERPIYFRQIRRLLLADGSEVFGCVHCDFTASAAGRVRGHLAKHFPPGTSSPAGTGRRKHPQIDVDELVARLARGDAAVARLTAAAKECDRWKKRALDAERHLAIIRRALAGKRP